MITLNLIFKLLYILLLLRAFTNYLRFIQHQPKQPLAFLLKTFEAITDVICKPFQNILYFQYDPSPLLAIAFLHYLGEPITHFIFYLCTTILTALL